MAEGRQTAGRGGQEGRRQCRACDFGWVGAGQRGGVCCGVWSAWHHAAVARSSKTLTCKALLLCKYYSTAPILRNVPVLFGRKCRDCCCYLGGVFVRRRGRRVHDARRNKTCTRLPLVVDMRCAILALSWWYEREYSWCRFSLDLMWVPFPLCTRLVSRLARPRLL